MYFIAPKLCEKADYVSACKMNMSRQACCRFEPHFEQFEHM